MHRRQFLSLALAGCGTLLIPRVSFANPWLNRKSSEAPEPHFFLNLSVYGGADQSYLYDARPLAMTAAGKIQNYLGEEPFRLTGTNGQACWATSLTRGLEPYRQYFSVLNGVQMATSFDGHDQSWNFLLSGNPFGGESFLPHLNQPTDRRPLDGVRNRADYLATVSNSGNTIILPPSSISSFKEKLKALPDIAGSELGGFLAGRYEMIGAGGGRFSKGARAMAEGFGNVPGLKSSLSGLEAPNPADTPEKQFATFAASVFKNGLARYAHLAFEGNFDTHDSTSAKEQPKSFATLVEKLAQTLKVFAETPYDARRSMLDVTTFMFSSEFSRTMRQENAKIDATGTDHNALTNTILLGGKGIKGGLVIGASDFQTAEETLSPAHLKVDPTLLKCVGRPFDFSSMTPRNELPEVFDPTHYLNASSVVNTIYRAFNLPSSYYRTQDRVGTVAPALEGLLS